MLYFSPFCLYLVYVNVYVPKSGRGDVPKSDVYKYSDPILDKWELFFPVAQDKDNINNILSTSIMHLTSPLRLHSDIEKCGW